MKTSEHVRKVFENNADPKQRPTLDLLIKLVESLEQLNGINVQAWAEFDNPSKNPNTTHAIVGFEVASLIHDVLLVGASLRDQAEGT